MRAIILSNQANHQTKSKKKVESQQKSSISRSYAGLLTLGCDFMFLMVSVGVALVFRALVASVWPESANPTEQGTVEWLPVIFLLGNWICFMGLDAIRGTRATQLFPFEYTDRVARHIYLRRIEIFLWMIASSLVLLCLCLFLVQTPLLSKIFLAGVVSLVAVAVRKSLPMRRASMAAATGLACACMIAIAIVSV